MTSQNTLSHRRGWLRPALLAGAVAVGLGLSGPSLAQRRIVGGEDLEDEDKIDKEAAEKAKKKKEAQDKKREEEKKKKAEERKKKKEEKKKAREAARKKAAEEKKKKEEQKERKRIEAEEKEKARLEGNRDARLQAAKKQRKISRKDGRLVFAVRFEPGQVKPNKLVEVKVNLTEELEVRSAEFGRFKPLKVQSAVAQVSPPDTGAQEDPKRYRIHRLGAPGAYGFHFTPARDGEHPIRIEGKTADGKPFSAEFSIFSGEWPPPDFESEEKNNAAASAAGGVGRRVAGGR